jgi:RimJ/RimL family protein N-acetyltransferase
MERLILRQWKDADLEPFAEMNADPEVMRHFPAPLSREQSKADLNVLRRAIEERGWGLWAVEVEDAFAGFTGLSIPRFTAHFTPCTEVGWRFRTEFWGRGLAHRAACEALSFGFGNLKLPEIVSFTAATNVRSQKLMRRLGFQHDTRDDFDHPALPDDHSLRRHVLYRKKQDALPLPPAILSFGQVRLRFVQIVPGNPSRGFVPAYHFRILNAAGADAGHINFRMCGTEHVRVCAGHIGFEILEAARGHGYAFEACRALAPFVRSFYDSVTITCNPDNVASIRTIERLGARFMDEVPVPPHDPHFKHSRSKKRYQWTP